MGASNSLNNLAANATLHCLTGCAIGEILGLMIGTAVGLSNAATVALAVALAFLFGYALSTLPLLQAGLGFFAALTAAFGAAFPVNRYLINKGKGHALTHHYHHGDGHQAHTEAHSPHTGAQDAHDRRTP